MNQIDNGRKLPSHLENPVDNICVELFSFLSPFFYRMHFTANGLTYLSAFFMFLSLYFLYKNHFILSAILYAIGYAFDCGDGYYARRYGSVSNYGDKLDHYKDVIVYISLVIIIIFHPKISLGSKVFFILFSILLGIFIFIYMGCQEIYYDHYKKNNNDNDNDISKGSHFLHYFRKTCKMDPEKYLYYMRWLGLGSYTLFVILFLLYQSMINIKMTKMSIKSKR